MAFLENGDINKMDDTARFMLDSGLLFEINRLVLHPFGLALEIVVNDETGEAKFGKLWDYRDDPEGFWFAPKTFNEGDAKFRKFCEEHQSNIDSRRRIFGIVYQAEPVVKRLGE